MSVECSTEFNGNNGIDGIPDIDEGDARGTNSVIPGPRIVRAPVSRENSYYNMKHPRRGLALIFNHEYFDVPSLKPRTGTNVDCESLKEVLEFLGFRVTVFSNLVHKDVMDRIRQAADVDHSQHDCLFVAVLTHGELGRLYARNTHYKADSIWHPFTADKCPTLAGKPKLFFIQACQGDQLDGGVILSECTETDGHHASYKIPIHADFLIGFSTIPGYYSWRNTTRGSWFIQALVQQLKIHGKTADFLTLLTFVNRNVAFNFESNTPDCVVMHQQKQVPSINFTLTRALIFGDKR